MMLGFHRLYDPVAFHACPFCHKKNSGDGCNRSLLRTDFGLSSFICADCNISIVFKDCTIYPSKVEINHVNYSIDGPFSFVVKSEFKAKHISYDKDKLSGTKTVKMLGDMDMYECMRYAHKCRILM